MRETCRKLFSCLVWFTRGEQDTALEVRIFNVICLFGLMISIYNIPFSFITGLPGTGVIFIVVSGLMFLLYYLARFKNRFKYSLIILGTLINVLFAVNYFYADGISGASLLSFTLFIFLMLAVSPRKQYPYWFALVLLTVTSVMVIEYLRPETVQHVYRSVQDQIVDAGSTVFINIVVILLVLVYLKSEYYREVLKAKKGEEKLKGLNDQKVKLFSVLSHDLQSPIHSLSCYLELIKSDNLNLREREYIEDLLSSTVRNAEQILDNILVWSRNYFFEGKVNLECHNVSIILSETFVLYKEEASKKDINYYADIPPSFKALVNIEMLKVVVSNLIMNAIKFTEECGSVSVTIKDAPEFILIQVKDSGQGIEERKRDRLFTLDISPSYGTANEKGVGFGLYLCRQLVMDMEGTIWFESNEGRGSSFFVQFKKPNCPDGQKIESRNSYEPLNV